MVALRTLLVCTVAALTGMALGWLLARTQPTGDTRREHSYYPEPLDGRGYVRDGAVVINWKFDEAFGFSEGLAVVSIGGKYGYINVKGEQVIPAKFEAVFAFREGLAGVEIRGGWGFIDCRGNFVIEPKFKFVQPFGCGLAGVCVDRKWGFIDSRGKFAITPQFEDARTFSEGICAVKVAGKGWGFIDKNGTFLIQPQFKEVFPGQGFTGGVVTVNVEGKWRRIDYTGRFLAE